MKHALLWGFAGATSVAATLGLSAIAHAEGPDGDAPSVTGPQAPGPEIPPGSTVPAVSGPQVVGIQAPGPVTPPVQPTKPGNGNGRGSDHPTGNPGNGHGVGHSRHGK